MVSVYVLQHIEVVSSAVITREEGNRVVGGDSGACGIWPVGFSETAGANSQKLLNAIFQKSQATA